MVSIILPNYDHSAFLQKRLDSIFNQTYENYEVIILDDASTDNSLELLSKYRNHPKVSHFVVNEVNSGSPFLQWNRGIELAQGDFIWIAESDDYADYTFLEVMTKCFFRDEISLVYCDSAKINLENKIIGHWAFRNNVRLSNEMCHYFNGDYFIRTYLLSSNSIPNASGVVFRKPQSNKYFGLLTNPSHTYFADWLFYIFHIKNKTIGFVPSELNFQRFHPNSVISKLHNQNLNKAARRSLKHEIDNAIKSIFWPIKSWQDVITLNKIYRIRLKENFNYCISDYRLWVHRLKRFVQNIFSKNTNWSILSEKKLSELKATSKFINAEETLNEIRRTISNRKAGGYFRFGDGDINLLMGKNDMLHDSTSELSKGMKRAFKLNVGENFVGLPVYSEFFGFEKGMRPGVHLVSDLEAKKYFSAVQHLINSNVYYNSFALHIAAVQNQPLCIDILKFIREQNPIFIGNNNIKTSVFEVLFGNEFIPTPSNNSFSAIDKIESRLLEILDKNKTCYRLVVVAMGCPGRILQSRILQKGRNVFFFDFGSLLDAFNGYNSRDWIELTGGLDYYQDLFEKVKHSLN